MVERIKVTVISYNLKDIAVCKELHQDGIPHYHVLIKCIKRIDTYNPIFFDIVLKDSDNMDPEVIYHPDISKPHSLHAVLDYMIKNAEKNNLYLEFI
jgi:hypothetical protein